MRNFLRRLLLPGAMALFLSGAVGNSVAVACPNCKFANETEKDRPRAYMYSILFMIGMPATIFTGFGLSFYRLVRNAQHAAESQLPEESQLSSEPDLADSGESSSTD
ncbi:MAG: hypothetical protein KDA89_15125 [Planctomycetaceae bacterium]|nr:hypothetical protein [Planctomycetaceae bacterium]